METMAFRSFAGVLALTFLTGGCMLLDSIGTGDSAGKTTKAATDAASSELPDVSLDSSAGLGCFLETTTQTVLCSGIKACPEIWLDPELFPTCGFRPALGVLDVECACSGLLCSAAVATKCEDVVNMLATQNQWNTCLQAAEGRCVDTGTGYVEGSSSPTKTKVCDEDCRIRCVDDSCLRRCGC